MDENEEKVKKIKVTRRRGITLSMYWAWLHMLLKQADGMKDELNRGPKKGYNLWKTYIKRLIRIVAIESEEELPRGKFHQYNTIVHHSELMGIWRRLRVFSYDRICEEQKLYFKGHEDYMKKIGAFPLFFFSLFAILGSNIVLFIPVIYILLLLMILGLVTRNNIIALLLIIYLIWIYVIWWSLYYVSVVIILHVIILGSNRLIYKTHINMFLNIAIYMLFIRSYHLYVLTHRRKRKVWWLKLWWQFIFDFLNNKNCVGAIIDFAGWIARVWKREIEQIGVIVSTVSTIYICGIIYHMIYILELEEVFPFYLFEFETNIYGVIGFVVVWILLNFYMFITKGLTAYFRHRRGRPCSRFLRESFHYLICGLFILFTVLAIYHYNIPIRIIDAYSIFYYWLINGSLYWFEKNLNRRYLKFVRVNYLINPYILIILYMLISLLLIPGVQENFSVLLLSPYDLPNVPLENIT